MSTDVMAPTLAELLREEADELAAAEDIGCPPNQDASCRHCGVALGDHATDGDPEEPRTRDNAVCLDDAALLQRRVVWNRFSLDEGESLVCPDVLRCFCDAPICTVHSADVATCADSSDVHHDDCVPHCGPCMHAIGAEIRADRARGGW